MARKRMSTGEFDLLIRSLHREFLQDPTRIYCQHESVFFGTTVHIFLATGAIWVTLSKQEYECYRPNGFFSRKEAKQWDAAIALLDQMKVGHAISSTEETICASVPAAKDIIAERALINDDNGGTDV